MPSRELDVRRRPMPGPGVVRRTTPSGPLESWARLDPTGLATNVVRIAAAVPGVRSFEQSVLVPLERRFLDLVIERAGLTAPAPQPTRPRPRRRLADLVDDAIGQTPDEGRTDLHTAVLDRLVPDEVRILAALADGSSYPLLHVYAGRRRDLAVLRNASTVGRAAEVVLPDRTPVYVGTLEQLGLVRIDAAERDLRDGYERLLAEPQVRTARAEADRVHRLGRARIERRTLRISDFGRELWDANRPSRAAGSR